MLPSSRKSYEVPGNVWMCEQKSQKKLVKAEVKSLEFAIGCIKRSKSLSRREVTKTQGKKEKVRTLPWSVNFQKIKRHLRFHSSISRAWNEYNYKIVWHTEFVTSLVLHVSDKSEQLFGVPGENFEKIKEINVFL